jgi:16S rRNA (uracil1498-N3)-methyltransferase
MVRTAKAHVFVEDVSLPQLVLGAADRHHLERVLRLRPGDQITVSDGAGSWRLCRLGSGGSVEPEDEVSVEPRPAPPVAVAFALAKGERPEWTVQKLTEVGVDRIIPFLAERSVVRWDGEKLATHSERFRRIAREAAGQCRRAWLPQVDDVARFSDLLVLPRAALADVGGGPPSLDHPVLLTGPEGGWSEAELAAAAGLPRVVLGPHILRAETAAVAAGILLCALRGGIVAPATGSDHESP